MAFEKRIFKEIYKKAQAPEDLPWYGDDQLPLLVASFINHHDGSPLRILDVGCGAGVYACQLAALGHEVTGLDFTQTAVDMARQRADEKGVRAHFELADVLEWQAREPFDMVMDCGCLHGFNFVQRRRYKKRLLQWLSPSGTFMLAHFRRRHPLDWRPIGPRRRRRFEIERFFKPHLKNKAFAEQSSKTPFPIGPTISLAHYWFERS